MFPRRASRGYTSTGVLARRSSVMYLWRKIRQLILPYPAAVAAERRAACTPIGGRLRFGGENPVQRAPGATPH